jgi:hypothetical protein
VNDVMHPIVAQTTTQPAEQARQWLEYLRDLVAKVPTRYWLIIAAVVIGWIVLRRVSAAIARLIRLRRPPSIHPSLQKYNVDRAELQRHQRELAAGVLATSTSNRLAGFRLVRQVEAVFVEGFASPEDALIALKATAVERGANAILNVQTQHTAAGRCTASGDAVVVAPLTPPPNPPTGGAVSRR